jgi:hypothetical protein
MYGYGRAERVYGAWAKMTQMAAKRLILSKDEKEIFTSSDHGLKALVYCTENYKDGPYELFDTTIGLAAAKILLKWGCVSKVTTPKASVPALRLLADRGIAVDADEIVVNILNKDGTDICPMEKMAMETEDVVAALKIKEGKNTNFKFNI